MLLFPFFNCGEGIMFCANRGVINGYEDGTFWPANTVTRNNLMVMLYPERSTSIPSPDTALRAHLILNYIALYDNNILVNTSFSTREDYRNITTMTTGISRYDMAMLMTNIMNQKGFAASTSQKNAVIANIADYNAIVTIGKPEFKKTAVYRSAILKRRKDLILHFSSNNAATLMFSANCPNIC